ncbi:trichohyalin [Drosophila virilis]|uniref:trichohyalin n=1 Tax=Drosophila virilis TaxID=7244 RepID=UPI0038B3E444
MPPNAHKSSLKIINAKYAAEMYEPEAESDEDCEVYFLKPVNEYNIVDKIKEANKQLFAIYDEEEAGAGQDNPNSSSRKVTFALNLEDYEPMTAQQQQPEEVSSPPAELLQQLAQLKLRTERGERFAAIEEEPVQELARAAMEQQQAEAEVEEDICEEILELSEMENSSSKQPEASQIPASMDYEDDFLGVDEDDLQAASEPLTADIQKHRIARQNTFDLNAEEMPDSDQRSLTNLLTESDCEEDERVVNEARIKLRQAYKSLYKTLDAKGQAQINRLTGQDNGDVEDDDLSIIVASYIPDDFELDERSIYYKKDDETAQTPNNNNTSRSTSTKTFFNARRFSFRRRARATPSAPVAPPPDIKMNYKICCEHRNALQEKLPRYTGYMSEYGLSAKQLQQRDQQLRRKQRFAMEQTLNRNEHELKKLQDNERAFTTWLKNKMRYPINKTRNMFDATRRRATVAAAASSPNPHQQKRREQQHEQLRSGRRRDSNEVHTYRYLLGSWNK